MDLILKSSIFTKHQLITRKNMTKNDGSVLKSV
jgi:hypothetical protein